MALTWKLSTHDSNASLLKDSVKVSVREVIKRFSSFGCGRGRSTCSLTFGFARVITLVIMMPAVVHSQDTIQRDVLENIARSQYDVLCGSEAFIACMGFSESACQALAEEAIKQCLLPLPEKINPEQLANDSIESCPKKVFEDAGFSDEKAAMCFDEAVEDK